jgi:hypothetical protein
MERDNDISLSVGGGQDLRTKGQAGWSGCAMSEHHQPSRAPSAAMYAVTAAVFSGS